MESPLLPASLAHLDEVKLPEGLDLAFELFHRINRVLPVDQEVLTIPPDCSARDAVTLMRATGFSQLPVVNQGHVLGVFSYRSFAADAAMVSIEDVNRGKSAPGDLRVDEYLEDFRFARVAEEINDSFDAMDRDNGLLVGTPERLIGVLTPMDFLRYLYRVARPFVMLSEIELALRAIVQRALTPNTLADLAQRCLAVAYQGRDIPTRLEQMSFDNYQTLIAFGDAWPAFEPILGQARLRVSARLKLIRDLRNDVFHFRREITGADLNDLQAQRNWLLAKVQQAHLLHAARDPA